MLCDNTDHEKCEIAIDFHKNRDNIQCIEQLGLLQSFPDVTLLPKVWNYPRRKEITILGVSKGFLTIGRFLASNNSVSTSVETS